jgi:pimeloyl-ACP methyl ester carboxylesterase
MYKEISFQDQSIHYQITGNGPCLLLLHGFCADGSTWDHFKKPFEADFTVICPDIFGFGKSDILEGFRMETMAMAIDEILQAESLESCYFVGHSMGGYVAMAFAELFPAKLKGLCLFHSQPFADTEEKKYNRQKTIGFMERWGVAPFVAELMPKLYAPGFVLSHKAFIAERIDAASRLSLQTMMTATAAMIHRSNRSSVLADLDCPVLFIIGALDEAIPPDCSEAQLRLPKHSTAIILDDVGRGDGRCTVWLAGVAVRQLVIVRQLHQPAGDSLGPP